MPNYAHDDNNNRIETLSKEEVYALLAAAIQQGQLPVLEQDTAFVTMVKSIIDGQAYKMAFCTQAQYNELVAQGQVQNNTMYYITDDTTLSDIETFINDLADYVDTFITGAQPKLDLIWKENYDVYFGQPYYNTIIRGLTLKDGNGNNILTSEDLPKTDLTIVSTSTILVPNFKYAEITQSGLYLVEAHKTIGSVTYKYTVLISIDVTWLGTDANKQNFASIGDATLEQGIKVVYESGLNKIALYSTVSSVNDTLVHDYDLVKCKLITKY